MGEDGFTYGDDNAEGGVDLTRKLNALNSNFEDIQDMDELRNYYQALKDLNLNRKITNGWWAGPAYLRLQRAMGGFRPGSGLSENPSFILQSPVAL